MLLDSTAIRRYALVANGVTIAAAVVVVEGGLDPSLVSSVSKGLRRPQGNLVVQQLIASYGQCQAGAMCGHRVMRIAVHHDRQNSGIGKYFLQQIEQTALAEEADYLSSSFGADAPLLRFWQQAGYQLVKLGFSRDAASGEHSAIVLKALGGDGEKMLASSHQQFLRSLPVWLVEQLRSLSADLTALAFRQCNTVVVDDDIVGRLQSYLAGRNNYDHFSYDLKRLTISLFANGWVTDPQAVRLLVVKVIQQKSWPQAAFECGFSGRKQTEIALKKALKDALEAINLNSLG
jgi:tRNA(Met) cytidine acetyltransferase